MNYIQMTYQNDYFRTWNRQEISVLPNLYQAADFPIVNNRAAGAWKQTDHAR